LIDFTLIELLIFGLATGLVSGFFGVGGGMVLIPILLFAGFEMKEAVAISIMQMVFSSIFGSFLNVKKNKAILKNGIILGIGGFLGGLNSGFILSIVSSNILEYLFMFIVAFAIYRIFNTQVHENEEVPDNSVIKLIVIGFLVGLVAMSIGVGGAVLLTPILVSYLNYNLKLASSMGLFFVVFSSIAGFTSLSISGQMLFTEGFLVGIGSLLGVFIGIKIKNIVNVKSFKKYILILYFLILISMIFKQF
jgi:uncharacterized membrane protein YfcA